MLKNSVFGNYLDTRLPPLWTILLHSCTQFFTINENFPKRMDGISTIFELHGYLQ